MTGKRLLTKDEFDLYVANLEQRLAGMGISPTGSGGGDIEAHNILSATHNDTTMAACVRGDIIIGDSAAQWTRLAKGAANTFLISDGTDPSWGAVLGLGALADPNADRIMFWDDSETALKWLTMGNSVAITLTTLDTIQDIRTTATPTLAGVDLGTKMPTTTTKARAYLSATQVDLVDVTWTKVNLNAESYDVGNNFDSTTNYRFTAPVAGYYCIIGAVMFTNIVADKRYLVAIRKNGTAISEISSIAASVQNYLSGIFTDIAYLAVNDYIELFAYHNAGVNTVDVYGAASGGYTYMTIHLLSI